MVSRNKCLHFVVSLTSYLLCLVEI